MINKKSEALAETIINCATSLSRIIVGKNLRGEIEDNKLSPASKHWLYEVLRKYAFLESQVLPFINFKPDKSKSKNFNEYILAILIIAIEILQSDRHPAMVVNEAVNACKLNKNLTKYKNLVNAVLRNYLRSKLSTENKINGEKKHQKSIQKFSDEEINYWHPKWWINKLKIQYPADYENILKFNNTHPPMNLRVNINKTSVEKLINQLASKQINAQNNVALTIYNYQNNCQEKLIFGISEVKENIEKYVPSLILEKPMPLDNLAEFSTGEFSLQDLAAIRALSHLQIADDQLILDCCAAPGGKACHIAEYIKNKNYNSKVYGLEKDELRAIKVRENIKRLQLEKNIIELIIGDANYPENWLKKINKEDNKINQDKSLLKNKFARILIDAPCSGSATVRRHPDGKWLRQENEIEGLQKYQIDILTTNWKLLEVGGLLLYSTCSSFAEENEQVIIKFLESQESTDKSNQKNAKSHKQIHENYPKQSILNYLNKNFGNSQLIKVEKLIPTANHDGHFFALLTKVYEEK